MLNILSYDQGVTGGLLTLKNFRAQFPTIDQYATDISQAEKSARSTYQGITVASYNLGCFSGALACIFIGNPLGRRRTIFLGTSIMVVGAILQASSYQLPQFIVGRLVTGFGNGLNTSTSMSGVVTDPNGANPKQSQLGRVNVQDLIGAGSWS
jgi:MFS family permease